MLWIGLTGSIATGKSTVAKILRDESLVVLDADEFSRQAVAKGSIALAELEKVFGPEILLSSGELNRTRLGEILFSSQEDRSKIESIIHPEIRRLIAEEKERQRAGGADLLFYDVPLLFEQDMAVQFDVVVTVSCSEKLQLERLMLRNQLSREDALKRMGAQIPVSEKEKQSDHVIRNDGDIGQLRAEVLSFLRKLRSH